MGLSFQMIKEGAQYRENFVELVVRNISDVPTSSDEFNQDMLHNQVEFFLLYDFILHLMDLFLITHMSLLDQLISCVNHVVKDL